MLSEVLNSGNDQLIPGYTVSPGDLGQYADFENYLAAVHLLRITRGAELLAPDQARRAEQNASALIAANFFAYPGDCFYSGVTSVINLPEMLYINLRVKTPSLTRAQVAKLITEENKFKLRNIIAKEWGLVFEATPDKKKDEPAAPEPSTGSPSSISSESTENSGGTKSTD